MPTTHRDYSSTPLARKLGIVSARSALRAVALVQEPPGFRAQLDLYPHPVVFTASVGQATELAIAFARVLADVEPLADQLAQQLPPGAAAWICWPKARLKPGFNEHAVRAAGLRRGLVDYKVCSINEDWSALKFARRRT